MDMASNNGQKLLVFGLGFAQHDNRKMRQVLRHYDREPGSPGSRAAMFVELTRLGKELETDEETRAQAQQIADWMRHGGEFPLGMAPPPINAAATENLTYNYHGYHDGAQDSQTGLHHRYGPGRTLTYPEDGPIEDPSDQPAEAHQGGHELDAQDGGRLASVGQAARGITARLPWPEQDPVDSDPRSDEDEENEDDEDRDETEDDEGPEADQMDMDGWGPPAASSVGTFKGRGRTLDDVDESVVVTEEDRPNGLDPAMPPTPHLDINRGAGVPQLRGDQQWRGNNVHGLNRDLANLHRGIPDHNMLVHGVHRRQAQAARRLPRPRMDHDLEAEEEELELEDMWGMTPGGFAMGRGRTLNDAEPAQEEEVIQQPNNGDLSESDVEDARPQGPQDSSEIPGDDDAEHVECPICLEEYPPSGFPKSPSVTDQCDHPDKACLQCLDSSITSIVESGALHLLACPICPQKLTRSNVREYASRPIYKRYKYLKQQASIPGHYISCTNNNCGGSQAHDSNAPDGPKMVCKFCQALTCATHRRPWHDGQTCLEYDMDPAQMERLEEEEATAKLLANEDTSICPKCGQGVTKTDGCDHMSCHCGTEWCYVCSAHYENILRLGAKAHATFCIYHPNKVNLTKQQQDATRSRIMGLVHGGEVSPELTRARDAFRQRRREEMRPKLAEAAEARLKQAREQRVSVSGGQASAKGRKVKLQPAWEEGGTTKRSL